MKLVLLVLFLGFWADAETPPNKVIPVSTCDFDFEEYLSEACKKIKSEGGELFKKSKQEATLFYEFFAKLHTFETKFKNETKDIDYQNEDMWNARTTLYNEALLNECRRNTTIVKFYDCVIKKREHMLKELDKLIAKFSDHA